VYSILLVNNIVGREIYIIYDKLVQTDYQVESMYTVSQANATYLYIKCNLLYIHLMCINYTVSITVLIMSENTFWWNMYDAYEIRNFLQQYTFELWFLLSICRCLLQFFSLRWSIFISMIKIPTGLLYQTILYSSRYLILCIN